MTLVIPPLKERGNDILELADAILERTCKRLKSPALKFSPEATQAISVYSWPGNVRELENAIERAVVLAESEYIGAELLAIDTSGRNQLRPLNDRSQAASHASPALNAHDDPVEELSLEDYFQRFVLEHQDQMNETQLARKLGISRKCLWERRQRFGLPRKKKQA
jgi:DNA-binding NtrC family response regulator